MKIDSDIVVAGAGPAGLVAARQLSQQGYSVLVVEAEGLFKTTKTWLTFSDVIESNGLGEAVCHRCSRGLLSLYTGSKIEIERNSFISVLNEKKVLRLLYEQIGPQRVTFLDHTLVFGIKTVGDLATVHTSRGRFTTRILVDASGGNSNLGLLQRPKPTLSYYAYARIYRNCEPLRPSTEVTLLDRGYPCPFGGQWSAPISTDKYLIGEFSFTTEPQRDQAIRRSLDQLRHRLDFYTWNIQKVACIPENAPYEEFYGYVPIYRTLRPVADNYIATGDAAGQARPFFGVLIDHIFEQTPNLVEVVSRAMFSGDFRRSSLSQLLASWNPQERINFGIGSLIWKLLERSSDHLMAELCSAIDLLDEDTKYWLLRSRLSRPQVLILYRCLRERFTMRDFLKHIRLTDLPVFLEELLMILFNYYRKST